MNKGRVFLALSVLIAFSGVLLLTLWGFKYNFSFGVCKINSYNIAPALNCDFASSFSLCDPIYCSNLYVGFTDNWLNNYTGFIPITFETDNIDFKSCWNMMSYSQLKNNLKASYPIGSKNICYANFKSELVLSDYSFFKLSHSLKVAGIVLTAIGKSFLLFYFIRYLILLNIKKPVYDVI